MIESKTTGEPPQSKLTEYLERRIVMVWRGADLGTISQGQEGVGASLQGDETRILLEDDAQLVCEPLHDQVERHVIAWWFGPGTEPKAHIQLQVPKADTTDRDLRVDEFLTGAGVKLSVHDAAERYGRAIAQDGELVLEKAPAPAPPGLGFANEARYMRPSDLRATARQGHALDEMAVALAQAFQPLRERIQAAAAIDDPAKQRAALLSIRADIPACLRGLNASPAVVDAMSRMMGVAVAAGMQEAIERRPQG